MPASNISPLVLLLAVGGSVLAYSGVKGKSISSAARALLAGQSPSAATSANQISVAGDSTINGVPVTQVVGGNGQGGTLQDFYSQVLAGIGAPNTPANQFALAGIVKTEGQNNYNNPFNIEYHPGDNPLLKGIGDFNGPPYDVQEYATPAQGVTATIQLLNQPHWANVKAALMHGSSYEAVTAALTSAYTWATFHPAGQGSDAADILSGPV